MSEPLSDPSLIALESALAGLAPVRAEVSRDRMLFRAGQASLRRCARLWPCAAAALAVLSAALLTALLLRPLPPTVERVVYVPVAVPPPTSADPATAPGPVREEPPVAGPAAAKEVPPDLDYLRLRQEVVEHGADALRPVAAWSTPAEPASLESLLGVPPGALPVPRWPRSSPVFPPRGAS